MDDATAADLARRVETLEAKLDELLRWKKRTEDEQSRTDLQLRGLGL